MEVLCNNDFGSNLKCLGSLSIGPRYREKKFSIFPRSKNEKDHETRTNKSNEDEAMIAFSSLDQPGPTRAGLALRRPMFLFPTGLSEKYFQKSHLFLSYFFVPRGLVKSSEV